LNRLAECRVWQYIDDNFLPALGINFARDGMVEKEKARPQAIYHIQFIVLIL
jgi:hypothetical protein